WSDHVVFGRPDGRPGPRGPATDHVRRGRHLPDSPAVPRLLARADDGSPVPRVSSLHRRGRPPRRYVGGDRGAGGVGKCKMQKEKCKKETTTCLPFLHFSFCILHSSASPK